MQKKINILNKRAKFEYDFIEHFTAGIVLSGTEIKSLRSGQATITESFCEFNENQELFVINLHIKEYEFGSNYNHIPKASRKLLLQKKELKTLFKEVKNSGLTIIPIQLFINENGFAKLKITLAKGKKIHDKRERVKERESKISLDRLKKSFNSKK